MVSPITIRTICIMFSILYIEIAPVIEMGNFTIGCLSSEGNIGGNYSNITGGQVRIYCRLIDGFPLPNISWFYMGSELIMFRNSSEISRTVENDTIGEYSCVATNTVGIGSSISFVDIQCKLVSLYCSSVIKTLVYSPCHQYY